MAAINSSSILHQPQSLDPASRSRKRGPPSGRQIKRSPSSKRLSRSSSQAIAGSELASTSRIFIKCLHSKDSIHTSKNCRLTLHKQFLRKHKVDQYVTMTDSAGLKLWHMRFQSSGWRRHPRAYRISNGWREFSYQHSLKLNDALLFTLVSSSHFVVEFATPDGSTRAMHATGERKDYPWLLINHRLACLTSVQLQALQEEQILMKIQVSGEGEIPQKMTPRTLPNTQDETLSQYNTVGHGKKITSRSRKELVIPELTHLECKYPDGSLYLQILHSDSGNDSETAGEDED